MRSSDTMMKAKNNGVYESLKERNDAIYAEKPVI